MIQVKQMENKWNIIALWKLQIIQTCSVFSSSSSIIFQYIMGEWGSPEYFS